MKICDIIKEKRIEQGLTQEQAANRLGVSAPAVNKWEKGISYPDITLLPPLARLLKTDLNTLLSFKDDLTDLEINKIVSDLALNYSKTGFDEAFKKCTDLLCEFPACDKLRLNLALALGGWLALYNVENKADYENKITAMFEHCAKSEDRLIKNQAVSLLISNYVNTKQFDKAQELIDTLDAFPMYDKVRQQSYLHVAKGEYSLAVKILEGKLTFGANDIFTTLLHLMNIAIKEKRESDALFYAHKIEKVCKLLEMWDYTAYSAYFQLYTSLKKEAELINTLEKMLNSLQKPWDTSKTALYSHLDSKDSPIGRQFLDAMINQLKTDPEGELAFVKDNPDFIKLINRY